MSQNDLDLEMSHSNLGAEKNETEEMTEVEKVDHGDIPLESNFLFLGVTGVVTLLFYWPGIVVLDLLGWETFQLPNWTQLGLFGVNMILDDINNIALLLAISWTTPLFVGMGSLLNIPVSVLLDVLLHSYLLPWVGFLGVVGIVVGFILLTLADFIIAHSPLFSSSGAFVRFWAWSWAFGGKNEPVSS